MDKGKGGKHGGWGRGKWWWENGDNCIQTTNFIKLQQYAIWEKT